MKKTQTFKNYEVDGIDELYNFTISVSDYILKIQQIDEDGNKRNEKFLMDDKKEKISKEEAEQILEKYMECSLEMDEIK